MRNRFFILSFSLALLGAALGVTPDALGAESAQTRFQRAAYVLQRLAPGIAWPSVTIPRRVINDDATNSLLKHPDTHYVLTTLARDLDALDGRKGVPPDAAFYTAQAYDMLNDPTRAADAMNQYTRIAPYRPDDYLFLIRNLYAARRYEATRNAARRWEQRDGKCSETRLDYVWGSYCAEGKLKDAETAVITDACQSWRGQVLLAKLRLEAGEESQADAQVNTLARKNPQNARTIRLFWNKLRAAATYP